MIFARRIANCLDEAIQKGNLPKETDSLRMAELLVNCWEGAVLRTGLRQDPAPLQEMLDFYFCSASS